MIAIIIIRFALMLFNFTKKFRSQKITFCLGSKAMVLIHANLAKEN